MGVAVASDLVRTAPAKGTEEDLDLDGGSRWVERQYSIGNPNDELRLEMGIKGPTELLNMMDGLVAQYMG